MDGQALRIKYQSIVNKDRNPQRMSAVVDFLFTRPIFSVRQAADGLGIPFKTAGDYIEKLAQAGMLREMPVMPAIVSIRQMRSSK